MLFCSCISSPFSIAITSLGEGKRELILVLFVCLFDMRLFGFVCFLFLFVSGIGCGLWLWRSLDFSLTFFVGRTVWNTACSWKGGLLFAYAPKTHFLMAQNILYTIFYLTTVRTPISVQSRNFVVFRLQPVYFYAFFFYKSICCWQLLIDSTSRGNSNDYEQHMFFYKESQKQTRIIYQ